MVFKPIQYWGIKGELRHNKKPNLDEREQENAKKYVKDLLESELL